MTTTVEPTWAYLLDGSGGGRRVAGGETVAPPTGGSLWLHYDLTNPSRQTALSELPALDPVVAEALVAGETRPRCLPFGDGLLVILRGVNLNPGEEVEDMVSLRLWVDADRVVSAEGQRVMALADLREALDEGVGPKTTAGFLVDLIQRITERFEPVLEELTDTVDGLEEALLAEPSAGLRSRIASMRRQTVALRRHLWPQRDMLIRLENEQVAWLDARHRARIREEADRVTRYLEDLDAVREHAAVTQDELAGRLSEELNHRLYVLSLIAAVFLPLGLLTDLLGVNVGGIAGRHHEQAFAIVCLALVGLVGLQVWLYRRLRWF